MTTIAEGVEILKKAVESGQVKLVNPTVPPTSYPVPDLAPVLNPLLRTTLPASVIRDSDTTRQFYAQAVPQIRVLTPQAASDPQINATAQSIATTVAKTVVSASSSQITLNVPPIFTPTTQTVTLPGPLSFSLASEPQGTVFKTPAPGLTSLTGFSTNTYANSVGSHATITFTPPSIGWAFYMEALAGGTNNTPPGWTAWGDGAALSISSTSPVTATDTVSTPVAWCNTALTFSGPIPTLVGNHPTNFSLVFGSNGSGTASASFSPTAGNYLIVSVYGTVGVGGSTTGISVSDSNGDAFTQVASAKAGTVVGLNGPVALAVFIAPNVVGSSTTVNGSVSGNFPGGSAFRLSVTEVTPFAAGSSIPVFQPLSSSDFPGISANQIAGGTLSLRWGGTGADLHATGGANQFVAQASAGAALTVVQPDFSSLAGAAGQLATSYNGVSLVSKGIPSEVATVDLTAQTAAKTTTMLYAVPAAGAGQYELHWNAKVTTPDGVSSTLGALTIVYTDPDGVVQTITAAAQNKNGTIETSDAGNSTTTVMLGIPMMLNCKASTNITYAMVYTSNTPGTMAYNLHIKLEAL
jgi:hypothetical protein